MPSSSQMRSKSARHMKNSPHTCICESFCDKTRILLWRFFPDRSFAKTFTTAQLAASIRKLRLGCVNPAHDRGSKRMIYIAARWRPSPPAPEKCLCQAVPFRPALLSECLRGAAACVSCNLPCDSAHFSAIDFLLLKKHAFLLIFVC